MERALLARHAESEFSVRGLTNGDPSVECGLTERGREQARHLAGLIAEMPIDLCAVSEFQRARETADIALAGRDVERLVVPELNDIRFGEFEGRLLTDYYVAGFWTLLERPDRTILVVSHGLPVRYVLNAAAGNLPGPVIEQVPYAEPFELTATELTQAVQLLDEWARAPTWPTEPGRG